MGVVSYDMEVSSPIPAAKMFKAFVIDGDKLIPKILPQAIKCVETIEGDGGPGSIKVLHFGEGSQYKTAKHKIDSIDKDNFSYSYTVIEGDALHGVLEKVCYEVKFVASSDGGCTIKNSSKYHTIGDIDIKEDQIKAGKEKAIVMFKAVESYLLANPDAY